MTLRDDLSRLAEEWERVHPLKFAECIEDVQRLLLSLPPESAPAPQDGPDLDALQKLCDEATPLPWDGEYVRNAVRHVARNMDRDMVGCVTTDGFQWDRYKDAPLIMAAVTALPELIAALRRARGSK